MSVGIRVGAGDGAAVGTNEGLEVGSIDGVWEGESEGVSVKSQALHSHVGAAMLHEVENDA